MLAVATISDPAVQLADSETYMYSCFAAMLAGPARANSYEVKKHCIIILAPSTDKLLWTFLIAGS